MNSKLEQAQPAFIPKYKIWLETNHGEGLLGDGKWLLLKTIQKKGSLMAAAEELGISYRNTWNRLKKIEKQLGYALIEKKRGGKDGGQSVLTEKGIKLVKSFDTFHNNFDNLVKEAFKDFIKDLKNL